MIVGQALKKLPRNDIVVETKCGIVWERTGSLFNKVGDRQLYKNLTPESIREEVEASLQRLGIDTIDIYMTHWQSVEPCFTPIAETVDTLNALKKRGKFVLSVRRTSMPGIREYLNMVSWISSRPYSILDRALEGELLPLCRQNGIIVQVYSPLEQGLLTGTIGRDYVPGGARLTKSGSSGKYAAVMDMLEWRPLCANTTAIPALALAWILKQSDLITLLSGATSPEQVRENTDALTIALTDEDSLLMREMAVALDTSNGRTARPLFLCNRVLNL